MADFVTAGAKQQSVRFFRTPAPRLPGSTFGIAFTIALLI